jgi:hypothetical protein
MGKIYYSLIEDEYYPNIGRRKNVGYTTDFYGQFDITPPLSGEDHEFLTKFAGTRRMKRACSTALYGIEGEFYVEGEGYRGQGDDLTVVDHNRPPSTQPGLWCQWVPNEDGTAIVWDDGEKFYEYVPWIKYLIDKILAPRGYVLNGVVDWVGEDRMDQGRIKIVNNVVKTLNGKMTYEED